MSNGTIVSVSPAMRRAMDLVSLFAPRAMPVTLVGPTGSGKEVLAQAIHERSGRAGRLVPINCAAFPAELIEGELFGYRRGAFSGAVSAKVGLVEAAEGGTLFLDEVASMPPTAQAKLLRTLESGYLTRLGETRPTAINVRFVAALQAESRAEMQRTPVRSDLLYRLSGVVIELPPLRARPEDIAPMAEHFADQVGCRLGSGVAALLARHPWMGNGRELRHTIERAAALSTSKAIEPGDVARAIELGVPSMDAAAPIDGLLDRLAAVDWNAGRAAAALGIGRATLFRRLKGLGLSLADARKQHRASQVGTSERLEATTE